MNDDIKQVTNEVEDDNEHRHSQNQLKRKSDSDNHNLRQDSQTNNSLGFQKMGKKSQNPLFKFWESQGVNRDIKLCKRGQKWLN